MIIIGITGGTGSGKTTALNALGKMGAHICDCDAIYHQLLRENTQLLAEIEEAFPGSVENGQLNRKKLGSYVFENDAALLQLNAITHKYVLAEVKRQLDAEKENMHAEIAGSS